MAGFYADENFPLEVSEVLRTLGHEVLTAHEAGQANRAVPDADVLEFAASRGLCVLTLNLWDFAELHARRSGHAGIVACTADVNSDALAHRVDDAVRRMSSLTGQLVRVRRSR